MSARTSRCLRISGGELARARLLGASAWCLSGQAATPTEGDLGQARVVVFGRARRSGGHTVPQVVVEHADGTSCSASGWPPGAARSARRVA